MEVVEQEAPCVYKGKVAVVPGRQAESAMPSPPSSLEKGRRSMRPTLLAANSTRRILYAEHDVAKAGNRETLVARVERERASFVLVNDAGIVGSYRGMRTVSLEDYDRVIAINETGVFLGMRYCAPLMRKGGIRIHHQHLQHLGSSRRRLRVHTLPGEQGVTLMTETPR